MLAHEWSIAWLNHITHRNIEMLLKPYYKIRRLGKETADSGIGIYSCATTGLFAKPIFFNG
jgi:hypothetical protein